MKKTQTDPPAKKTKQKKEVTIEPETAPISNVELLKKTDENTLDFAGFQEEIGNKVQYIRKEIFKFTQKELADACGMMDSNGQSTIYNLEKGRGSAVSIFLLFRFFAQNGININYFFNDERFKVPFINEGIGGNDSFIVQSMKDQVDHFLVNLSIIQDKIAKTENSLIDFKNNLGE